MRIVHGVPIACRKRGMEHNNNPKERDNARIRQRTKTMRGFKFHECAEAFLNLLDVVHNFIRPSLALKGGCPPEAAGMHLPWIGAALCPPSIWPRGPDKETHPYAFKQEEGARLPASEEIIPNRKEFIDRFRLNISP